MRFLPLLQQATVPLIRLCPYDAFDCWLSLTPSTVQRSTWSIISNKSLALDGELEGFGVDQRTTHDSARWRGGQDLEYPVARRQCSSVETTQLVKDCWFVFPSLWEPIRVFTVIL